MRKMCINEYRKPLILWEIFILLGKYSQFSTFSTEFEVENVENSVLYTIDNF